MIRGAVVVVLGPVLSGCIVFPGTRPDFTGEATVASQFNHRGMVQNERGVFKTGARVDFDTRIRDGRLGFEVEGYMDLDNSTGDAWFPDGHGGKLTEIDFEASYTQRFGKLFVTSGLAPYVLANGTEFVATPAGSERGETKEVFVNAELVLGAWVPFLTVHYDFDEAEGFYVETGALRGFPIGSRLRAEAEARIGATDEDHALWTYGLDESGVSDASVRGSLFYLYDESTEIRLSVVGSTILDSGLDEWFDLIGIDSDNLWFSLGILWSY